MFCLFDGRSKRLHSIPQQTRQEGIEKFVVTCLLFWCKYFVWNTLNWKTTSLTNLQLEKLLPPQAHTCFGQKGNQTHNRPSVVHFGFIICSTWSVIADIPIVGCRVNDTKCRHISPFGHWRVIEHFCKHSLRFFDFFRIRGDLSIWEVPLHSVVSLFHLPNVSCTSLISCLLRPNDLICSCVLKAVIVPWFKTSFLLLVVTDFTCDLCFVVCKISLSVALESFSVTNIFLIRLFWIELTWIWHQLPSRTVCRNW